MSMLTSASARADEWALRASVLEFLAFSLRYPTRELSEAAASGEWADAAAEVAVAIDADKPMLSRGLQELRGESSDEDALFHGLRAEATRLFVGPPEPAVSPYEGIWRADDDGVDGLLFVNPYSVSVERFMACCGLGRPEGTNEPLDHVATELELLQHLASLAAGIIEPPQGAVSAESYPGGSPEDAYLRFFEEHALAWMPLFAQRLLQKASHPFYGCVAQLVAAALAAASNLRSGDEWARKG